ncbi:GNAT family N-acetyltransferase [Methylobacterium sp. NEAU 140]|uniref:GNAT family N-acetyltransferase n=1 Tax=Methylobacterium sp. NEAU 140 TaxID=3064945 RepID=UPI0027371C57|nr:GNAT family N-acetyltransferase [Methylobacterium sp. NEAU 140]MDP4025494.1 GNAT family N-acetyltransferase [Methylobacterium sp. NEAU 140]
MSTPLQIRPMDAADTGTAMDWAAREGWNPGLSDGPLFRALDPAGFLVGTLAGDVVATLSVAAYDARFAFLGLYIVRPDLRGRGHGRALWAAGLARAGARIVGLDGVLAREGTYRRGGFATAHRNIRFAGPAGQPRPTDPRVGPRDPVARDPDALVAFDARHVPGRRPAFARAWIKAPGHGVRVARVDGRIAGYGVVRPAREGHRIGPLFAEREDLAEALFTALSATCAPGEPLALDAPEPNAAAARLAERHGLSPVFETARMYRGPAPDLPLGQIYGLASLEVG